MKVIFTGYNEGEDESDFTVGKEYRVVDFFGTIYNTTSGVTVIDDLNEHNDLYDGEYVVVPEE